MSQAKNQKWYDFGQEATVSLRMIGSIPGNYVVRLVLPKEPIKEQLMRAYETGWSRARNDDGHAFDHLTPVKSLSEVSTRLMAFFPKEKIAAALKVAEQPDVEIANPLPVKEDAAAIAERMISHFASDSPDELLRHIRTSIAKAQTIVGDRMAVAKKLPFGGDGFAIYERLRERSDETHAAEWFSAVLWALSEQIDGWEGELERLMEADARGSTDLPQPDERIVRYVAREKEVFQRFEAEGFTGKPLSEALFGSMVVDLGGNVPYRAYDGALINPAGAPDLAKNTFIAQAGVSNAVAADAKARLTSALTASARAFGISRDRLFGANEVKFMLGTAVSRKNSGMKGAASTYQGAGVNADGEAVVVSQHGIKVTPTSPGVLLHEIGHQIHKAGGEAEILRAVTAHPFARRAAQLVSILEEQGMIRPDFAGYLLKPEEIFARAFDAHVFAQVGRNDSGGAFATVGQHPLTPVGEELSVFMADMRTVVLENRSSAEQDAGRDRQSEATFGQRTALGV